MTRTSLSLMAVLCLGLAACTRPAPEPAPEPMPVVESEPVYDKYGNPV